MPITVRPVLPAEHDGVRALTLEVYVGEGYADPDYVSSLSDVAGRARDACVLVAVEGGRVLAAVTVATRLGPWAEQAVPGEAVIRMLVTARDARGRGLGEALVRSCLEQACADGCTMVRLSSQEDMTAAHRLYERLGFTRTPSFDWEPVPGLRLRTYALPLAPWCGQCGEELIAEGHARCRQAAALDPPRFCAHCRRRMVVQVTPTGWTARCVEHGLRGS